MATPILVEKEVERICEDLFERYSEMETSNNNFEDIILKYALDKYDSVTDTATFLFNYF